MTCVTPEALSERVRALEKLLDDRIESIKEGIKLAKENNDFRLEGMNEFRNQLTAQASSFLPKSEYIIEHRNLIAKIEVIEKQIQEVEKLKANIQGRIIAAGGVMAGITVLVQIIIHVFYDSR